MTFANLLHYALTAHAVVKQLFPLREDTFANQPGEVGAWTGIVVNVTIMHVQTYIHTYIRTYIHTCIHTSMHACMHACMHAYIYIYIYTCLLLHTFVRMDACMVVCACASMRYS